LANRVGYPRATIFGDIWQLAAGIAEHADSAYTRTFLEPHTDGAYSADAPGLQLFACIERDGDGGESILVDGFAAAARLRTEAPERFELLTRVAVPGRYIEAGVHLQAARPTIGLDGDGEVDHVTFNNYDRAPFLLPADEMLAWYEAYGHLHRLIVDRRHWLLVRLEPGDVLLFDNWRVLHGRMAYSGRRVFEGCYHNREDFESRLRVLRAGDLESRHPPQPRSAT
jgi:trimethyllysine dioxygenase